MPYLEVNQGNQEEVEVIEEVTVPNLVGMSIKEAEKILKDTGLVKNQLDGIKVLGNGKLEKSLTIQANKFSTSALEKIKESGSKAEVI